MAMQKVGDWKKVEMLIGNLAKEMENARQVSLKRWALKAEALAKQHMSKQDLGWTALAPKTLAAKVRKKQSTLILIATSDYFQAITSWVKDNIAYAGVKKEAKNEDGDLVADIARIHEFGAGNTPARPLWTPAFEETLAWYVTSDSTPTKIFAKNIQKYL